MSDWGGYKALRDQAAKEAAEDRVKPIEACPLCGEPLEGRNGVYNCPLGHFRVRQ
jgi:hypothetical protein